MSRRPLEGQNAEQSRRSVRVHPSLPVQASSQPAAAPEAMMVPPTVEFFQVGGAVLILVGFVSQQLGQIDGRSLPYLLLNVVGAGTLAVVAYLDRDWGFLLLEGSWAFVALASVPRRRSESTNPDVEGHNSKDAIHTAARAGG